MKLTRTAKELINEAVWFAVHTKLSGHAKQKLEAYVANLQNQIRVLKTRSKDSLAYYQQQVNELHQRYVKENNG